MLAHAVAFAFAFAFALSALAEAKRAPPPPPMQAPNVAAEAMVAACDETREMGREAVNKALGSAAGTDPRAQGKPVTEHLQVLHDNGVSYELTVDLPATISVSRDGIEKAQQDCMAWQGKDDKKFMACAPKLYDISLAYAGAQTAMLDTGQAFMHANNISIGCRAQAIMTATSAEKTNLLGGGEPDDAADDPHYRKILEGAKKGDALAAGINALIAGYQAVGAGALDPSALGDVIDAIPEVLDVETSVSDEELELMHQQARADAAADPMVQQAIKDMEE